jgi:hypothetical protein
MDATDFSDLPVPPKQGKSDFSDLPVPPKEKPINKFKQAQSINKSIPYSERAGAIAYGAGTAFLGAPGELEKFASYTAPQLLGLQEKGTKHDMGFGRETFFPTVEEMQKVAKKVGIEEPKKELKFQQNIGELIGGFGMELPRLLQGGVRAFLGTPSRTSEEVARRAEAMGFSPTAGQVKQDMPTASKGTLGSSAENQRTANTWASLSTGERAPGRNAEINRDFLRTRIDDLGQQFDNVYQGRVFNIDPEAVDIIRNMAQNETLLPNVAANNQVRTTAQQIVNNFDFLANRQGAIANTFGIEGEALQRIRNSLTEHARSTSPQNAREIYGLVDAIDASVARNHADLAETLNRLRPFYRNTMALEELMSRQGISKGNISLEQLGNMLGSRRGQMRREGTGEGALLDQLAEIGTELKFRSRGEKGSGELGATEDALGKALRLGGDVASVLTGRKSRTARALQRNFGQEPETQRAVGLGLATAPEVLAAGEGARLYYKNKREEK